MIKIKSEQDLELMRKSGKILAKVHSELRKAVKCGISTLQLNEIAEEIIYASNAIPSFKTVNNYKHALCTSINEEVVHTIPSNRILKEGDLLTLDCGVCFQGFHTDAAQTLYIGENPNSEINLLLKTAKKALEEAIKVAKVGNKLNEIGKIIEKTVSQSGFSIIKDLTGHGIGKSLHEEPTVLNFYNKNDKTILMENMTLAIEPIFCTGKGSIKVAKDGWNIKTTDLSLAVQIEHTIIIKKKSAEIITKF
jgi:methionyl aminopeptidase